MQKQNFLQDNCQSQRVFYFVILLVIAVDQITKLLVRASLALGESQPEGGVFRLTRVANDGGIFGISLPQPVMLFLPVAIVIAAFILYHRYFRFGSRLIKVGFGMVVGGSIGNLIDRFYLGHVTDFIDLRLWNDYHWPSFNIADSAIVIGTVFVIMVVLRLANSAE